MKKFLKLFKKNKIRNILKKYKCIYICRNPIPSKINLTIIKNLKNLYTYNIKLNPILNQFSGQGRILFFFFNDYSLIKLIFFNIFLDTILVKTNFIFSKNKLNKIFSSNITMFLNLFIISFVFIANFWNIKYLFFIKHLFFYKYLLFNNIVWLV